MRTISGGDNLIFDMFKVALQLEETWKLVHVEYDDTKEAWHLMIDFERGATFACPACGAESKAYDAEVKKWRHLNFWHWKTYIHARVPRTNCKACNKVIQVPVKWSRPLSHFTLYFEAYAMRLMAIAVDETSSRRGHRYITLFVDADAKTVVFATEDKGMDTLGRFKQWLNDKGASNEQIEEIYCDMSPAFIRGIQDYFPQARITFDKFHVMKLVNESVDDVRIAEQKQNPELKHTKYIWLKNESNLLTKQKETLVRLKDSNLQTGRAYRLKLAIQEFWSTPHIYADIYLREWIGWAMRSQLTPMVDLAKTIKQHEEGILRWFHSKMTNGLLESIKGLVQAAKRRARGYRNVGNLIAMVYMTANRLRLPTLGTRRAY